MQDLPERPPLRSYPPALRSQELSARNKIDYETHIFLYILAFKYDLDHLQKDVANKLASFTMDDDLFWEAAQHIYRSIPFNPCDHFFFFYFRTAARGHIVHILQNSRLLNMADEGGDLAKAITYTMGSMIDTSAMKGKRQLEVIPARKRQRVPRHRPLFDQEQNEDWAD
ncbi:MAG: hypothetical protein M1812_006437 [Candelaria pacifica]|nr:MAG: hypothetical protein M1812_006437 [Candelaria pacifica]